MTYTVRVNDDDTWDLLDSGGNVVSQGNSLPITAPDDIIDDILDDMGVGGPQKEAFRVLLKQDWTIDE